jgi:hypothetical protein
MTGATQMGGRSSMACSPNGSIDQPSRHTSAPCSKRAAPPDSIPCPCRQSRARATGHEAKRVVGVRVTRRPGGICRLDNRPQCISVDVRDWPPLSLASGSSMPGPWTYFQVVVPDVSRRMSSTSFAIRGCHAAGHLFDSPAHRVVLVPGDLGPVAQHSGELVLSVPLVGPGG